MITEKELDELSIEEIQEMKEQIIKELERRGYKVKITEDTVILENDEGKKKLLNLKN